MCGNNVVTLATSGPEGIWAAAVFYAEDGFELTFLSAEHTRHARNIASQSHVAATIQEDYADWPGIQGIQLKAPHENCQEQNAKKPSTATNSNTHSSTDRLPA